MAERTFRNGKAWPDKSRNFIFTLNNYKESEIETLQNLKGISYIAYSKEIGEKGTPHLQGYVIFKNPRSTTISNLKKLLIRNRSYLEPMAGNLNQNDVYISKQNHGELDYEWGTKPVGQGVRSDLKILVDKLRYGEIDLDWVLIEQPMAFHQYGRTLEAAEDLYLRSRTRTEMPECYWLHGPTSSGKSHYAFTKWADKSFYVHECEDRGWYDRYKCQDVAIFNEFRGGVQYSTLLGLCDKWPKSVVRRNKAPIPFVSSIVVVTSVLTPEECYYNLDEKDSLAQLKRRFTIIQMGSDDCAEQKWSEGVI